MGKKKIQPNYRRRTLRLPDLDHSKLAVLNSLASPGSRRVYEFALDQFIAWYCSEPRLAFNRIVVTRYRIYLESRSLAANTINQQLAAVRRLAHEAADAGLLSPELAAGISRVREVKQLGFRVGTWLSADECSAVLSRASGTSLRAKRDYAMLAILFGCGLRRSELVGLDVNDVQIRQGHWAIVDLIGKGGHIRTVPIPLWVKAALDEWTVAAGIGEGKIFRAVARTDKIWGDGISQNVVWYVVNGCAEKAGLSRSCSHGMEFPRTPLSLSSRMRRPKIFGESHSRPPTKTHMAKHNFDRATSDNAGNIDGAMCSRCGKTVKLENGDIPDEIKNEECRPEVSQNAAQIVRSK